MKKLSATKYAPAGMDKEMCGKNQKKLLRQTKILRKTINKSTKTDGEVKKMEKCLHRKVWRTCGRDIAANETIHGESGMSNGHSLLRAFTTICLVLTLGVSMSADAGLFGFGGDSWKEEVLLHDGQKIIVKRSQSYGGRHEIGQSPPIKEHTITFTLPGSNNIITWTSEYGEDLGRTNFDLLAVHVLNGTPYIVAEPSLCLSYNKWGRPNPPYVFFKYDGRVWQRIPLEAFPAEFKTINVALDIRGRQVEELVSLGLVSAEIVQARNSGHTNRSAQYRTILREVVPNLGLCPQYSSGPKAPISVTPSTSPK